MCFLCSNSKNGALCNKMLSSFFVCLAFCWSRLISLIVWGKISLISWRGKGRPCKMNCLKVMQWGNAGFWSWFQFSTCAYKASFSRPRHRVPRAQSHQSEGAETKARCPDSSTWWARRTFASLRYPEFPLSACKPGFHDHCFLFVFAQMQQWCSRQRSVSRM